MTGERQTKPLVCFCCLKQCFLIQIPKDPEHLRNWYSAQEFCSNYDGSLAILEDELEQGRVLKILLNK